MSRGTRFTREDLLRIGRGDLLQEAPSAPVLWERALEVKKTSLDQLVQELNGRPYVRRDLALGIDPGVSTGLALWSRRTGRLEDVWTLDFWGVYDWMRTQSDQELEVWIEDPAANRPTFDKEGVTEAERRKREKVSQDVGANKREGRLLIAGLLRLGFQVRAVRPRSPKMKDAVTFGRLYGWKKTNQHERDAARLVVGL